MSKAILYDATLCIGCKQCEEACAKENNLPYNEKIAAESLQSDHKYTTVLTKEDKFMRRLCMNCEDPACVSVCPVGALRKTPAGPVVYEADRCMGCRYCMVACPFSVPKYEWDKTLPKVRKCTMCPERVLAGRPTACAEICPTGATSFGEREELIAEAKKRLRENPANYVNRIYGLSEVGGTSVFLLSSIPVEQFGYPAGLTKESMPVLTYRALEHIPDLVTLGTVLLGGIWWITNRRTEVAAAEEQSENSAKEEEETRSRHA